jgi:hypothetical protein
MVADRNKVLQQKQPGEVAPRSRRCRDPQTLELRHLRFLDRQLVSDDPAGIHGAAPSRDGDMQASVVFEAGRQRRADQHGGRRVRIRRLSGEANRDRTATVHEAFVGLEGSDAPRRPLEVLPSEPPEGHSRGDGVRDPKPVCVEVLGERLRGSHHRTESEATEMSFMPAL